MGISESRLNGYLDDEFARLGATDTLVCGTNDSARTRKEIHEMNFAFLGSCLFNFLNKNDCVDYTQTLPQLLKMAPPPELPLGPLDLALLHWLDARRSGCVSRADIQHARATLAPRDTMTGHNGGNLGTGASGGNAGGGASGGGGNVGSGGSAAASAALSAAAPGVATGAVGAADTAALATAALFAAAAGPDGAERVAGWVARVVTAGGGWAELRPRGGGGGGSAEGGPADPGGPAEGDKVARGGPAEVYLTREAVSHAHELLRVHEVHGMGANEFFDLLQRSGEDLGLMDLDDERFDEVVPLVVAVQFARDYIRGMVNFMLSLGFEPGFEAAR
jgi:hypothetical protein